MKGYSTSILLIALCLTQTYAAASNIFVAQLTSEGARSNVGPNPFEDTWPFGENEITSMGLRQHYLVGYDLRVNYADKLGLNKTYSPWQVNVRSTNHNVTLMGAQSELEAIYQPDVRPDLRPSQALLAVPPGDNATIVDDIKSLGNKIMPRNFQTLPIHSVDFDKDTVLMGNWCSKIYEENQKKVRNTGFETAIEEAFADTLKAFRGFMKNDALTVHEIYAYLDGLYASYTHLDNLGELATHYTKLMDFRLKYLQMLWSGEQSRRILSNGFLIDLERYMEDARKQSEDKDTDVYNEMKLSMYFGTWEIVYVVSQQLGFNHTVFPQFASQLLFELNRADEGGYYVSAHYNKQEIIFGGDCNGEPVCALQDFYSLLNSKRASEADITGCAPSTPMNFLSQESTESLFSNKYVIGLLIYATLSAIVAFAVGYKLFTRSTKRRVLVRSADSEALLE